MSLCLQPLNFQNFIFDKTLIYTGPFFPMQFQPYMASFKLIQLLET